MGGGSGSTSVVTENPIPVWAKDEITLYLNRSRSISDPGDKTFILYEYTGTIPSENDTYAKRNNDEIDGINALANRARNGSDIVASGKTLIQNNLDSVNLNSDTNNDDIYDVAKEELLQELDEELFPSIEFEALSLNMFGSSGHAIRQAKTSEKALKQLLNKSKEIYYGDYRFERNNQDNNLPQAINYGTESTRDAELLRQAGLYDREYEQGKLTAAYREYHDDQMFLIRRLEVLGNALRAIVGAQYKKVVEPFYRPSSIAQIAGFAMAGAGLAASFYGAKKESDAMNSATKPNIVDASFSVTSLTNPDSSNRLNANNSFEGGGVGNEW